MLLEDEAGSQDGAEVEFALLAKVLGATAEPSRLVVLNACASLEGADDLLRTVPTVMGMSESSVTFAAQFYAAIAPAQSVATAVEQARTAKQTASLEDSHQPELVRARTWTRHPWCWLLQSPESATWHVTLR